ncbi:MAG: valine--tRNA ligase [Candidatus Gracilibacteria bacterium]|nr:valine--tRNA ligase [Candidatus Gracilibacteria bacterium]
MTTFSKKYEPENFEKDIYKNWEKSGDFLPKSGNTGKTFYIPIPPPNVTGVLHLGHALTLTLEDIMVRYHRMIGDETLWIPGTDHAGISTQARVEKMLAEKGITRESLGRDEFLKHVWEWKNKYGNTITNQIRMMGSSCDWTKERFTLDEGLNKLVTKAFVDLYNKKMIYLGEYMVNYSPALNTVLSDQEVIYKEEKGKLYHITYFVSGSDNEVIIATTRPETLLGDEAVAVHPKDKRYKALLKGGKKLILPILNREIPLIADEMVDINFGTGAVKITPAHDPNDFEVAKRHNLPMNNVVLGKDGKMTQSAGIFAGQDFVTARENIVALLKSKGNLIKIEDYNHKVGYCERSGCKVETIISTQWFVKVDEMAKKVINGYKKKDFVIIPDKFNKIFEDWIYNLRDWCISRQLWWGHRIPAYYHKTTGEMVVSEKDLTLTGEYTRDEDVLDTWFSSALWPFSVLDFEFGKSFEEQNELYKKFYSAQVLETGHDIIFFWVIRMLLFGYEFTGKTPFEKIYLHGLIKDKNGKKMSKSSGNGIDPIDMIEKYSTDALRLTVSIGNTPGNDLRFDEDNVMENKIFINKLWNATRFVYTNLFEKSSYKIDNYEIIEKRLQDNYEDLLFSEKWILSRLRNISDLVNIGMEKYNFSESGIELQNFTKNEFCDYYIEEFKITRETSKYGNDVIIYVINNILKLWHPYIPFVTEELWNKVGFEGKLILQNYSKVGLPENKEIESGKQIIIEVIKEIRNLRAENNIMPSSSIKLLLKVKKSKQELFNDEILVLISGIVKSESTLVVSKIEDENLVYAITKSGVEIFLDNSNAKDMDKEIDRLKEQITDTKEYIGLLDRKLLNESFVRNAPASLVRAEMEKKAEAQEKLRKLEEKLEKIK